MKKLDQAACKAEAWVWNNPGKSILGLYLALFLVIGAMLLPVIK